VAREREQDSTGVQDGAGEIDGTAGGVSGAASRGWAPSFTALGNRANAS